MKSYIHYGLGFSASLLTEDEMAFVRDNESLNPEKAVMLNVVPFGEDFKGKDYATIVFKDFGQIANGGKITSIPMLKSLFEKEDVSQQTLEKIKSELAKFKLEHLEEKVDIIVYIDNY